MLVNGHEPGAEFIIRGVQRDGEFNLQPFLRKAFDARHQAAGAERDSARADIEGVDEATPLSYERYTGNWLGSSCGWLLTKETMPLMIQGMRKTLPGLHNFYMAGQWVEPGGSVPMAAVSGRNAVQVICHQDGRPFVTR